MREPHSDARARLSDLDRAFDAYVERRAGARSHSEDEGGLPAPQLARLLEISQAMNRIHDRAELLTMVGDWLRELFDAENSFVILFDESGRPTILSGHLKDPVEGEHPISETILERVRATREPILIDNTADLPDLKNRSSIEQYKIASVLCAPLVVGERVIGALQFDHRGEPHPFPESDLRLLAVFAGQAATAFNNLQLIEWHGQALEDLKAAHSRLVQAERLSAVGEMAAGIAHDFNNTLFVALGFCDVLLAKDGLRPDVRGSVEKIRTCALDAADTVRRLQVFARGGVADEATSSVGLGALVEQMVDFTRHKWADAAQRHGVSIRMCTEVASAANVRANPAEIREVLTNLIFNAVDAMQRSGTITLSTGVVGERAFVAVRDEGIGMDAETQRRMFEPFFTTKGARGCGFGLATCWSISRRLGGEITVSSAPGAGSTLTLWLPVDRRRRAPQRGSGAASVSRASVLVIDDDREVLGTLGVLLEVLGHEATCFTDALGALRSLDERRYDVVITDLGMPSVNGAQVAREVARRHPSVPVLILTGWGPEAELEPDVAACAAEVVGKPITLEGLRAALGRALGGGAERTGATPA